MMGLALIGTIFLIIWIIAFVGLLHMASNFVSGKSDEAFLYISFTAFCWFTAVVVILSISFVLQIISK
ncbi:hypothetical protein OZX69_09715 (plasmid) [Lactobacillus sp. ESL0731]|uniref:hypothetical protein n=1 Tax=unclassified Lactobacillus TaxID=2620435 RepID=UPI0023F8ECA3|nr:MULTISPECIES: hypothetical protein [unclassified Lactobacillus]WEV52080.1 hypothetical protein OZX63_09610 [Lactobacillus sp. ESL0700]WEV63229.1 hypothetical protein OZX69_09715 [Lactobacillus sp. ESL0731]